MCFENTCSEMLKLDYEEQIGYAYFCETKRYLNYIDLSFLLKTEDPLCFSILESSKASEYRKQQNTKLNECYAGSLCEQFFIPEGINSEIQHLPRYIDIPSHRHDFFELVCILCGHCLHKVESQSVRMEQGDITIIPPNVRHYLQAEHDCMALTIKIRKTTFDSAFSILLRGCTALSAYFTQTLYAKHYRNSLTFHCGKDSFLTNLLLHMLAQQSEKKQHYNHVIDGLLSAFFPYLIQNYENTIEFADGDNIINERMSAIENYMRQNYRTATLVSTAAHFYLSPAYLSTTIKKQTGCTFSGIMQQIRIEQASRLLSETTMKIDHICESVGYQDTTQFIRTFKKYYGTTPRKYRAQLGRLPSGALANRPLLCHNVIENI